MRPRAPRSSPRSLRSARRRQRPVAPGTEHQRVDRKPGVGRFQSRGPWKSTRPRVRGPGRREFGLGAGENGLRSRIGTRGGCGTDGQYPRSRICALGLLGCAVVQHSPRLHTVPQKPNDASTPAPIPIPPPPIAAQVRRVLRRPEYASANARAYAGPRPSISCMVVASGSALPIGTAASTTRPRPAAAPASKNPSSHTIASIPRIAMAAPPTMPKTRRRRTLCPLAAARPSSNPGATCQRSSRSAERDAPLGPSPDTGHGHPAAARRTDSVWVAGGGNRHLRSRADPVRPQSRRRRPRGTERESKSSWHGNSPRRSSAEPCGKA